MYVCGFMRKLKAGVLVGHRRGERRAAAAASGQVVPLTIRAAIGLYQVAECMYVCMYSTHLYLTAEML